jgi:acyl carrier protein
MTDKTLELLQSEIAAALGLDPAGIKAQDRIVADLGAESLDLVDLTFRIEKGFGIQIPQGTLFESRPSKLNQLTVQDVADYILEAQTRTGV